MVYTNECDVCRETHDKMYAIISRLVLLRAVLFALLI